MGFLWGVGYPYRQRLESISMGFRSLSRLLKSGLPFLAYQRIFLP